MKDLNRASNECVNPFFNKCLRRVNHYPHPTWRHPWKRLKPNG